MPRTLTLSAVVVLFSTSLLSQTQQPEWKGENLQYFPKDIGRAELIQRMREFSFGLNVRCQYCHAGGDGVSLQGVSFASDEKPAKIKARAMLRMVDQLNESILPQLASRATPRVTVECVTCHHGLPLPKSLQTTLLEVIDTESIAAAIAKYRSLREDTLTLGRYNFGEWEMNELARRLMEAGKSDAAIAMLELNGEFNPKSPEIDVMIGEMHRQRGEPDKAAARYRAALGKSPEHRMAKQRLAELEKKD